MLYPDELHLARLVVSECVQGLIGDSNESVTIHANALLPRLRRFIPSSKIGYVLNVLESLGEIRVLGMGWYEPLPPVGFKDLQISVGLSDAELSSEFPNAYSGIDSRCVSSDLGSWLGPPFNLSKSVLSIFYEMTEGINYSADSCEVYWADYGARKLEGKNWSPCIHTISDEGLIRFDRTWFKEFYQHQQGKVMPLTPSEAYELAALKDFVAGIHYPFGILPGDEADFAIKAKRYYPKSIHKLCLLLSQAVDVRGQTFIYELSQTSFEKLKEISADYIQFSKGF